jgi:hypothetical protein
VTAPIVLGVTGSRAWRNRLQLWTALDRLHAVHSIRLLLHGGARGADRIAAAWAIMNHLEHRAIRPDYARFGRGVPVRRTAEIVDAADIVIAFRTQGVSNGTDHGIRLARQAQRLYAVVMEEPC